MKKEFQWTDELVQEYVFQVITGDIGFSTSPMEKFKAYHTPEVKRDWEIIEERKICYDGYWTGKTKIFSVRRLSDNEVFSMGEYTTYGKIDRFIISRGEIEVHFTNGNGATLASISKLPQRTKECNICCGELVLIRGRYPNSDKREVCPTCATERLEQINELSSNAYGVAMKESSIPPLKL